MPNHPRANAKGYVKRSVLNLEHKLGRFLLPTEFPHHMDKNKQNDSEENLVVVTKKNHYQYHAVPLTADSHRRMSESHKILAKIRKRNTKGKFIKEK
jgi:hypothetical protein